MHVETDALFWLERRSHYFGILHRPLGDIPMDVTNTSTDCSDGTGVVLCLAPCTSLYRRLDQARIFRRGVSRGTNCCLQQAWRVERSRFRLVWFSFVGFVFHDGYETPHRKKSLFPCCQSTPLFRVAKLMQLNRCESGRFRICYVSLRLP